jgi:hypothetical protein
MQVTRRRGKLKWLSGVVPYLCLPILLSEVQNENYYDTKCGHKFQKYISENQESVFEGQ